MISVKNILALVLISVGQFCYADITSIQDIHTERCDSYGVTEKKLILVMLKKINGSVSLSTVVAKCDAFDFSHQWKILEGQSFYSQPIPASPGLAQLEHIKTGIRSLDEVVLGAASVGVVSSQVGTVAGGLIAGSLSNPVTGTAVIVLGTAIAVHEYADMKVEESLFNGIKSCAGKLNADTNAISSCAFALYGMFPLDLTVNSRLENLF